MRNRGNAVVELLITFPFFILVPLVTAVLFMIGSEYLHLQIECRQSLRELCQSSLQEPNEMEALVLNRFSAEMGKKMSVQASVRSVPCSGASALFRSPLSVEIIRLDMGLDVSDQFPLAKAIFLKGRIVLRTTQSDVRVMKGKGAES